MRGPLAREKMEPPRLLLNPMRVAAGERPGARTRYERMFNKTVAAEVPLAAFEHSRFSF